MRILVCRSMTHRKDLAVDAEIIGQLAIHPSVESGAGLDEYAITHIASGGNAAWVKGESKARKVAKALDKLDWSKVKSEKSRKALAKLRPLRQAILDRLK